MRSNVGPVVSPDEGRVAVGGGGVAEGGRVAVGGRRVAVAVAVGVGVSVGVSVGVAVGVFVGVADGRGVLVGAVITFTRTSTIGLKLPALSAARTPSRSVPGAGGVHACLPYASVWPAWAGSTAS